ncbi:TadE family type IV pilus minor pilin [Nesterenkonia natronophila]|uniref:Pilus assembly protein TadE n=1 Tax=Nesterenkonia natronophila TaxID=2174932 RepID=A0A3A4FCS9_9MICC|nr:TadE family type IV pilus minor pilin [Nesterenkonia natronophila]RJN32584.1 pilus assembly protein TadE [Nesterenkonia natronophila]
MTAQRNLGANSSERGSVTAEFALAIPGVVLVMLLVLSLAMQGAARIALEEGARAAARELARGESAATAEETLRQTAGDQLDVTIAAEGQYTAVVVTQPIRVLGLIELSAEQSAEAHARTEHLAGVGASR